MTYPKITQEDFLAMVKLQEYAGQQALSWSIEGGDRGAYTFSVSLNGIGKGERFFANDYTVLADGITRVITTAEEHYRSLREETQDNA